MKTTIKWEQPTMSFRGTSDELSKLFYKISMSFTKFQHKLDGLDKRSDLKC